jgi:hypothetical protein
VKLPNFLNFAPLNHAKVLMGLPPDAVGSFFPRHVHSYGAQPTPNYGGLGEEEQEQLESGEGIDVSIDQITFLDDGTIAYKDSRVLLYIRDVHTHGDQEREPKYHLMKCRTLDRMIRGGRFERYVIASEITGKFKLNMITDQVPRTEWRHLLVCENCLTGIRFNGFRGGLDQGLRHSLVKQFRPSWFFEHYPRMFQGMRPVHTADTAPLNNYPADWNQISRRERTLADWTCQRCRRKLSGNGSERFLDVHHVNGNRSDNSRSNLKVLCVACHAKEPEHHHMRNDPRHREFLSKFRR